MKLIVRRDILADVARPTRLTKAQLDKDPYLKWNAFIDLIAVNSLDQLTDIQAVPKAAWKYDSEIQNGGHIQFFENVSNLYKEKTETWLNMTIEALKILGATCQHDILVQASQQYFSVARKHPQTAGEFVELELGSEFEEFDNKYYDCSPDMNSYLQKYLDIHSADFVEVV